MRPISVVDPDGTTHTNFQSIVPMDGLQADYTVLDPILAGVSTSVDLPTGVPSPLYGHVHSVVYPGGYPTCQGGSYVLDNVQVAMNNLLRLIADYKEGDEAKLEKSVANYQAALVLHFSGKDGLINRHILTSRRQRSFRSVAVADISHAPDWVGLPRRIMETCGLRKGNLTTLTRYPILHEGGVEVVRAYPVDDNCIHVHPVLCKQLGLDFDGDNVAGQALNSHIKDEGAENVLSYFKACEDKDKPYPVATTKGEQWAPSTPISDIHEEVVAKLAPTGQSIGPADLLNGNVEWYEKATGKELIDDNQKIISGLSVSDVRQRVTDVNFANLVMKRFVGPAGALGSALKVLALGTGKTPVIRSAMYINEHLTQSLMDAKHNVGATESQGFMKIMDSLNCTGVFKDATAGKIMAVLIENGMDEAKVRPFCDEIFSSGCNDGVKVMFAERFGLVASCTTSSVSDLSDLIHDYRLYRAMAPHVDNDSDALTQAAFRALSS